jgi:PEGA domain
MQENNMNIQSKKLIVAILILTITTLFSGCATIFNPAKQKVTIGANVPGAKVYIDGVFRGETPLTVKVPKKKDLVLEVRKEGYKSKPITVDTSVGIGWVLFDIVFLVPGILNLLLLIPGVIALAVDGATGNWRSLDNDKIDVTLVPAQQ